MKAATSVRIVLGRHQREDINSVCYNYNSMDEDDRFDQEYKSGFGQTNTASN